MPAPFELRTPVQERPQREWGSVAAELAGAEILYVQGRRWRHRVVRAGSEGPPLFLYHGIGGHAETFARNVRALSARFQVHAVDAVFHGFSGKEGFELASMYDLLAEGFLDLVDALGFASVHLLGESMGAQMGATVAVHHPERVDRMILNAGFYLNTPTRSDFAPSRHSAANLGQLSARAINEPTRENIAARLAWLVSDRARLTEDIVSIRQRVYEDPEVNASLRRIFNMDAGTFGPHLYDVGYTHADLEGWKPETLVLWGEHNPGHGPDYGAYWADVVGAAFYSFDDAGHWPQWEKPDEYNAVVLEYLTA